MKKTFLVVIFVMILCLSLLAACGDQALTADEAINIALKDAGRERSEVSVHTHVGTQGGKPCYEIHVEVDGEGYTCCIDSETGEILDKQEGVHE